MLQIKWVEANVAKTSAGLSENPGSTDDLVRVLEDSGYPVDGSREQFIPQPDVLSPSNDRGTTGGEVAEQDKGEGTAGRAND